MAILGTTQKYFADNPDVMQWAIGEASKVSAPGTPEYEQNINQLAYRHYSTTGVNEAGRNVSAFSGATGTTAGTTAGTTTTTQPTLDLAPIQTGITGLQTGQTGLMTGQKDIQTGITGLQTGQETLQTGVTDLGMGQRTLQTGITGLETGQAGLMTGQQTLGAGQGAIQGAIGTPAEGQPTTLFAGQQGLMGGQQALGQQLTGGFQDVTGGITGLGQNIDALEAAAEQYRREAQRQRAQMQTAGLAGREQISRQVADVGQQVNTGVEMQRAGMAGQPYQTPQMGMMGQTPAAGVQQAAAQYAQTAQRFTPPAQGQQTVMGPMGPMTVDPRDQITQPVSTSGLMNYLV